MKTLIVVGGPISKGLILEYIKIEKPEFLIGVDGGLSFFYEENIMPDYVVGDFDSLDDKVFSYYKSEAYTGILEVLNPMKDDTDTEHALSYALEHGATSVAIFGATGKRMDHTLAAIDLLGLGLEYSVPITMYDNWNRIRLIKNDLEIKKEEQYGTYVSLLPYSEAVEGVTLKGFMYPLTNGRFSGYRALGVSNEIVEDVARISFTDGILLVIESRDEEWQKL